MLKITSLGLILVVVLTAWSTDARPSLGEVLEELENRSKDAKYAKALNDILGGASLIAAGVGKTFNRLIEKGEKLYEGNTLVDSLYDSRNNFEHNVAEIVEEAANDTAKSLVEKGKEANLISPAATSNATVTSAADVTTASSVVDKRSIVRAKKCTRGAKSLGSENVAVNKRLAKRDQDIVNLLAQRLPYFPKHLLAEAADKFAADIAETGADLEGDLFGAGADLVGNAAELAKHLEKDEAEAVQSLL